MIVRIQGGANRRYKIHYEFDTDEPLLGEGGMGRVYRGWQVDEYVGRHREVAIKELRQGLPEHVIERARLEASIRLKNDSLIEMIDFIEEKYVDKYQTPVRNLYVVSEYLPGVNLDRLLEGGVTNYLGDVIPFAQEMYDTYKSDPFHFALTIVRSLLSGLTALHDAGYIHRDIDPSNIMLTAEGHIKLIDFGVAKDVTGNKKKLTSYGQFIGKAEYAAPEAAQGLVDALNFPTDLYAVGIVLFQLIAGHVPFSGEFYDVLAQQCKTALPLKEIRLKELRKVLKTATEKDMKLRYQTASEFRVAIDKLMPLSYPQDSGSKRRLKWQSSSASKTAVAPSSGPKWHRVAMKVVSTVVTFLLIVGIGVLRGVLKNENRERLARDRQVEYEEVRVINEDLQTSYGYLDSLHVVLSDEEVFAKALAQLKNESTAAQGFSSIKGLTSSKSVGYEATFLLSRLYFHYDVDKADVPDSVKQMKCALGNNLTSDNTKGHKLLEDAVSINGRDYHSLYELGCDYMSRKRGADKDLQKAGYYLSKASKLAIAANDQVFYAKIMAKRRLIE